MNQSINESIKFHQSNLVIYSKDLPEAPAAAAQDLVDIWSVSQSSPSVSLHNEEMVEYSRSGSSAEFS